MTRDEKLDRILLFLIAIDYKELNNERINKPITLQFINDTSDELELVPWEMKSLEDELVNDKLVIKINEELRITQEGKKFITKDKGFKNKAKIAYQEELIREGTIKKFKYDVWAFWVSIIAIIISIVSLIINWNFK